MLGQIVSVDGEVGIVVRARPDGSKVFVSLFAADSCTSRVVELDPAAVAPLYQVAAAPVAAPTT